MDDFWSQKRKEARAQAQAAIKKSNLKYYGVYIPRIMPRSEQITLVREHHSEYVD